MVVTRSALAPIAEDGDPRVDGVGSRQDGAAAFARFALPVVYVQFALEVTWLPRAGAIVPNGGATRVDRIRQDSDDMVVEPVLLVRVDGVGRP